MRLLSLLLCLIALIGCGSDPSSKVYGLWRVDPATISSSRLAPNAATNPDWIDATKALGALEVHFYREPNTVRATGLGHNIATSWTLRGSVIELGESAEKWPTMIFDPKGPRIHVTIQREAGTVQMDLVKAR